MNIFKVVTGNESISQNWKIPTGAEASWSHSLSMMLIKAGTSSMEQ
jgi:hypothetical protein